MYYLHNISEYANRTYVIIETHHKMAVKFYNELKDGMMVVPLKCNTFLKLKPCFIYETNKVMQYLISKYRLKRSISRMNIFEFAIDLLRNMYKKANPLVWSNYTLMKNYFY